MMYSTETAAEDPSALAVILRKRRVVHVKGVCKYCLQLNPSHGRGTCPSRPCYLCRKDGHQQIECPYRLLPGAQERALKDILTSRARKSHPLHFMRATELGHAHPTELHMRSAQVDAKVVAAVHAANRKRITALEFMPGAPSTRVLSGDKSGTIVIWDFGREYIRGKFALETSRFSTIHRCNVNYFCFAGPDTIISSSSDGYVCRTQLDTARAPFSRDVLLNLNPRGFVNPKSWKMAYGLSIIMPRGSTGDADISAIIAGDDEGNLYGIDPRSSAPAVTSFKAHSSKIQHVDANSVRPHLLCTSSNDKSVRLWDARMLKKHTELAVVRLPESVASSYFSPNTGCKLLITSLQNSTLIYNDVHKFGEENVPPPDVTLVHSHQFNRYLSLFRSVWDPKDVRDDTFLCGRFLGEAYNVPDKETPVMLHPIDIFAASSGAQIASLVDSSVPTVCPVNRFHCTEDLIVSGSSMNLYLWGPASSQHEAVNVDAHSVRKETVADNDDLTPAQKKHRIDTSIAQSASKLRNTKSGKKQRLG